jgi:hypothetical protein
MSRCVGRRLRLGAGCLAVSLLLPTAIAASPAPPSLSFRVVVHTSTPLSGLLWTGQAFLYTGEGQRTIYATDATGHGLHVFATVPENSGEMRCILSPGRYGFPPGTIYCHAAGGQIYRIGADGRSIALAGTIPTPPGSDGALTFDTSGTYGHTLLAATGGSDAGPGALYAIEATGRSHRIGTYSGPGGAENIAIAPPGFGAVAGQVLITIDKHDHQGRLLAMDAHGMVRTLVRGLTYGLNPIAPILARAPSGTSAVAPGLYVADWRSRDVLFVPAATLRPFASSVIVGTERRGLIYLVQPQGAAYRLWALATNLHAPDYNLEGARYIAG